MLNLNFQSTECIEKDSYRNEVGEIRFLFDYIWIQIGFKLDLCCITKLAQGTDVCAVFKFTLKVPIFNSWGSELVKYLITCQNILVLSLPC